MIMKLIKKWKDRRLNRKRKAIEDKYNRILFHDALDWNEYVHFKRLRDSELRNLKS